MHGDKNSPQKLQNDNSTILSLATAATTDSSVTEFLFSQSINTGQLSPGLGVRALIPLSSPEGENHP